MLRIISLFFLLIFSEFAFAQSYSGEASFEAGFHAGINGSDFYGDTTNWHPGPGFTAGMNAFLYTGERAGIFAGAQIGTRILRTETGNRRLSAWYLDVPVLVEYKIGNAIWLHGGLYCSAFLTGEERIRAGSSRAGHTNIETAALVKNDLAAAGGLGFRVGKQIRVTAGYRYGILAAQRTAEGQYGIFDFTLGVTFYRSYRVLFGRRGSSG